MIANENKLAAGDLRLHRPQATERKNAKEGRHFVNNIALYFVAFGKLNNVQELVFIHLLVYVLILSQKCIYTYIFKSTFGWPKNPSPEMVSSMILRSYQKKDDIKNILKLNAFRMGISR